MSVHHSKIVQIENYKELVGAKTVEQIKATIPTNQVPGTIS